jgi:4-amino-4-deoxy-L-arabinose transferase-like glycosyltransferase
MADERAQSSAQPRSAGEWAPLPVRPPEGDGTRESVQRSPKPEPARSADFRDALRVRLLGQGRAPWTGSWRGGAALVALCLLVLLPGLFQLPAIDRDESRFAQASRQMLESGDWVVPRVQDRPRLNKPPLIYWLQASSVWVLSGGDVTRDAIWMYRVPGALCTVLTVLAVWRLGRAMFDPRAAFLAAAMLAVCPLVVFDAHQARADQLLLLATTAAMSCLWMAWRAWRARGSHGSRSRAGLGWSLAFWACVALGVLAKGPVTPMVAALCVVAASLARRDWSLLRATRPFLGVPVLIACVAPWVVAVVDQVGWDVYSRTIFDETLGRSVEPAEGHKGPPGYHLVLLVGLFFPGSILTGAAVVRALREGFRGERWRLPWAGKDREMFLLAWGLPTWLVMELVRTKLPHYTMPLYPALALLTARGVLRASSGAWPVLRTFWARAGVVAWTLTGVGLAGGATMVLVLGPVGESVPGWLRGVAVMASALCMTLVAIAGGAAWLGKPLRALVLSGAAIVVAQGVLLGVVLPRTEALWTSRALARHIAQLEGERPRSAPIAMVGDLSDAGDHPPDSRRRGYHEDSLIFETRGRAVRLAESEADAWMSANPDGVIVAPERWGASRGRVGGVVWGFNYSRGKWVWLTAERVRDVTTSERGDVTP